jgi:minimal PKS ketosynthase (KS/KS alpha)
VRKKAAVVGVGVATAGAVGVRQFWDMLTAGRTATRRITSFDPSPFRSQMAGECDFNPTAAGLSADQAARLDRTTQLALACAIEAHVDSGLDFRTADPSRVAVSIGSAVGCTTSLEREYVNVSGGGRDWLVDHRRAGPELYSYLVPSSIAADVASQFGVAGPVALISNGCTSGLDAVRHGARLIEEGTADIVLAGASDAPISPITVACFDAIKATSPNNADPEHACRPFDLHRDGFVLGEGAAMMILADRDYAARHASRTYAEIAGCAARANAYHMTGLKPDGREMAEAIGVALERAGVAGDSVDYINAHGSGTLQNDRHETSAFKRSLGEHARRVPVSSIKSMVGHSLGAIGSIELAACVLAIQHNVVPPTANLRTPDPECDLDYVPLTARELPVDTVLSVGSGFGGFQAAVVLTAPGRQT